MPSKIPVGRSGGCPRWCAASTVNTTTPTTEVTNVDARAAGAVCAAAEALPALQDADSGEGYPQGSSGCLARLLRLA